MSKTRVCMIAYTTYSYDARIRREAETLVSTGRYAVTLIVPKEGKFRRTYQLRGVEVREVALNQYQGKRKLAYMGSYLGFIVLAFVHAIAQYLASSARIFHIHNMPDILAFTAIVPRLCGAKVILDVHDTMAETYSSKFGARGGTVYRMLAAEEIVSCRIAHRVISVNSVQGDVMRHRGVPESKLRTILNVPDDKIFVPVRDREYHELPGETFNIVYHGTLANRLGVDLIVRAATGIIEEIPHARVHLIGAGDDVDALQELVDELGLGRHVTLPGGVPVHQLPPILRDMQIGMVANRRSIATELMLPVKMMEYFALGIPVVAPRLRTITHYVSDDMARFFNPGNSDELADAVIELYRSPERRSSQARRGLEFIDRYGWSRHKHDLIDMYDRLVPSTVSNESVTHAFNRT